ncbi:MAG: chromosome partitioning protein [Planctomycetes bacterium]|jgi:chromosome partitioning protein|nr:chromosome partitioning protein [Planctomycetota bacterium]
MTSSMEILALVNQKGGCGKTTTAVNLAGALADRGRRVLLVDLDPQAHATMALGQCPDEGLTLAEVLGDELPVAAATIKVPGGLDLLPSSEALSDFEVAAELRIHPEQLLHHALEPLAGTYDTVVIDCPPRADGILCANALRACTTAVLVIETGAFALQGALKALDVLARTAHDQEHGFRMRAVATLFDRRTRFARELLVALQARFGPTLFDTVVRTSVRLREAAAHGLPIQLHAPASRAAGDFAALATEVLALGREELAPAAAPADIPVARQVPSLSAGGLI